MRARCLVDISGRVVALSLAGAGSLECVDGITCQAINNKVDLAVNKHMAFNYAMILNIVHKANNAAVYSIAALRGEITRVFSLLGHDCCIFINSVIVPLKLNNAKVSVYMKYSIENEANRHLVS